MSRHFSPGDYLMVSDFSGRKFFASEMAKDYYGNWVHKSEIGLEASRHPQELVKSRRDPYPEREVRAEIAAITTSLAVPFFIGLTNVATPCSPADSALGRDCAAHAGIGEAFIATAADDRGDSTR